MKRGILYLLLLIFTAGCSDHTDDEKPVGGDQVRLILVPERIQLATRAGDEDIEKYIEDLTVLVFEEIEGSFIYTYRSIAEETATSGKYNVTLRLSDVAVKLLLIANHTDFADIQYGCSVEEATESLIQPFTNAGINSIPMYGEFDLPDGLTSYEVEIEEEIPLLRSVAAVEVSLKGELHAAGTFILKSIEAYRANNQIQVIPHTSVFDREEVKVTAASIPETAENNITTFSISAGDATVKSLGRLYLPESEAPAQENITSEATCLIIGGIYRGEDLSNDEITYYRIDFKRNITGQILRNYLYSIEITEVTRPGTTHPEEADGSAIKTVFTDWSESDHPITLKD
ncbi:MAG: fimbrial protein [Tannerellaceae bacterium]|nr:fimbrial protein [Tannerellaceae bacterium]